MGITAQTKIFCTLLTMYITGPINIEIRKTLIEEPGVYDKLETEYFVINLQSSIV